MADLTTTITGDLDKKIKAEEWSEDVFEAYEAEYSSRVFEPLYFHDPEELPELKKDEEVLSDNGDIVKDFAEAPIRDENSEETSSSDEDISEDEDGDELPPNDLDMVVHRFEDYRVVRILNNRSFRKVYLVKHIKEKTYHVITVCKNHRDDLECRGYPREIMIMKKLLKAKYHVSRLEGWKIIRRDEGHSIYAFVTPYYPSCSLVKSLATNPFAVSKFTKQCLLGLQEMHRLGVMHRDIATYNILWDPIKEVATIIDFDSASWIRHKGSHADVGRDNYDAPEKVKAIQERERKWEELEENPTRTKIKMKHSYNESVDLYALGVVLYMLVRDDKHSPDPKELSKQCKKWKNKRKQHKHPEVDLVFRLVTTNPERRITVDKALEHEYISNPPGQDFHEMGQRHLLDQVSTYHEYLNKDYSESDSSDDDTNSESSHDDNVLGTPRSDSDLNTPRSDSALLSSEAVTIGDSNVTPPTVGAPMVTPPTVSAPMVTPTSDNPFSTIWDGEDKKEE